MTREIRVAQPAQQGLYVTNPRDEIASLLPAGIRSVLEVGCGRGGFGSSLRRTYGDRADLVAVEPVPEQAEAARAAGVWDAVHHGYFPDDLPPGCGPFDLIVFNDVLEHMVEPWAALRACHDHLVPGGRILATIPSIQYAPALIKVARGRWDYTDDGTLDRTHLRFFTRATMVEMFEDCGYRVDSCTGVNSVEKRWATDPSRLRRLAKRGLARALGDARYVQFVIVATSVEDRS